MAIWNIRFYIDPETDEPHIYNHAVTEDEVHKILSSQCWPRIDGVCIGGNNDREPVPSGLG